jgi:hypothetical protein
MIETELVDLPIRLVDVVLCTRHDPVWMPHHQFDVRWPVAMAQQRVSDVQAARKGMKPAREYPCPGKLRIRETAAMYPMAQCDRCGFTICVPAETVRDLVGGGA